MFWLKKAHWSRKGWLMKKTLIISLALVFVCVSFLALHGYVRRRSLEYTAYRHRKYKLLHWHKELVKYLEAGNSVPATLHGYCSDVGRIWFSEVTFGNPGYIDEEMLLGDPEAFEAQVKYSLLRSRKGWFIREDETGRYFRKMLMIDEKAKIYILEKE